MKKRTAAFLVVCFVATCFLNIDPVELKAEDVFVTIGSGDLSGVYFPAGLAIAKIVNQKRSQYGIRATVESTPGSVFNLNAILAGYLEFGLAQADKQFQAVNGLTEWLERGPQQELRSVFSLHRETVTLVAAMDAAIAQIEDLKGKRVNIGNPGSGQHRNAIDVLEAAGLDPKKDMLLYEIEAFEAPELLLDHRIDAFFSTLGHPSETIQKALSGQRKAHIVPISSRIIDKLVGSSSFYTKTAIPVRTLYPVSENSADVISVGVAATLCTSSKMSAEVVYALAKEVFENLEMFRQQHPALHHLTKEGMLEGLSAPLHPGALRYFKETSLIK